MEGSSQQRDPSPLERIRFRLKPSSESVWAESLGNQRYRIQNVVVLAQHVSVMDVVRCTSRSDEIPEVVEVVERGPYCTIGIIFDAHSRLEERREILYRVHESGGLPGERTADHCFAVVVPRTKWNEVIAYLESAPPFVGWEILCGPDAPTPFSGPFDPPE